MPEPWLTSQASGASTSASASENCPAPPPGLLSPTAARTAGRWARTGAEDVRGSGPLDVGAGARSACAASTSVPGGNSTLRTEPSAGAASAAAAAFGGERPHATHAKHARSERAPALPDAADPGPARRRRRRPRGLLAICGAGRRLELDDQAVGEELASLVVGGRPGASARAGQSLTAEEPGSSERTGSGGPGPRTLFET